jgi:hypothetical protein
VFAQKLEPLGALGDLGWYSVRALQMVYGETTLPERVWASAKLNDVPFRHSFSALRSLFSRIRAFRSSRVRLILPRRMA